MTTLFVTHSARLASKCSRVLRMEHGSLTDPAGSRYNVKAGTTQVPAENYGRIGTVGRAGYVREVHGEGQKVLFLARYEASQMGSKVIGSEHLLLGLIKEGDDLVRDLFVAPVSTWSCCGPSWRPRTVGGKAGGPIEIPFSEETKKILACAEEEASASCIRTSATSTSCSASCASRTPRPAASWPRRDASVRPARGHGRRVEAAALPKKVKETPFLNEFARDLSEMAARQVFDPLIGRENELQRMIQVLSRRRKNSIVLLASPASARRRSSKGWRRGSPKGACRCLLPQAHPGSRSVPHRGRHQVPRPVRGAPEGIISEIMGTRTSSSSSTRSTRSSGGLRGGLARRGQHHQAGLSRGEVQCIGATTPKDYHRYIEKDRALVRRFQPIRLHRPRRTRPS